MSAITMESCRGLNRTTHNDLSRTVRDHLSRVAHAQWNALLNRRIRIGQQQDEPITVSVRDVLRETPFFLLAAGFIAMLILL
ncbi:MAG TPA: hypothetical protein P5137_09100 [Candidatus Brocadiia bacterium]|nr:hypothetical protein [Candidatus Brocadiia bacterium]